MKSRFWCVWIALFFSNGLSAQGVVLYGITAFGKIYKLNTETCEICLILDVGPSTPDYLLNDLVVLPDGDILVLTEDGVFRFNPPSSAPVWSSTDEYIGAYLAPDGLVYLSTTGVNGYDAGLSVFDPATNTITFVGYWPTAMIVQEFFLQNGILYAHAAQGPGNWVNKVVQVDLVNPGNTVIVQNTPPFNLAGGTNGGFANGGFSTQIFANPGLYQYFVSTNSYTLKCNFAPNLGLFGLTDLPPGLAEDPCVCSTDAGSVVPLQFNPCGTNSVTVPYNNDAQLESGDLLQYVLFTNPADTLGSILVQSNSPFIPFNPALMQPGVTYYIATIAGNNLNGNVDLNDPCVDFSNAVQVIWRPRPTVVLTVLNPNACPGACLTVSATFTGSPAFILTYTAPGLGPTIQTFTSNSGTFQVCLPPNAPVGSGTITATALADAFCNCQ
ncbi:MAG: hypothetical protein SFV52_11605 [Saprospiraceae bacterium]|nr:hypothetical protein [Saprospiraceae bacterium]